MSFKNRNMRQPSLLISPYIFSSNITVKPWTLKVDLCNELDILIAANFSNFPHYDMLIA